MELYVGMDVSLKETSICVNHAAEMGGNFIVAQGPVTDAGQQTFSVYKCP